MKKAAIILLGLAGCASADPPPMLPAVSIPPSLGPRYETYYVEEAINPALRSERGLVRNQSTSFLFEEDRVYDIKACSAGRMTNIKFPPGEELTGETLASFGDTDETKWGIASKKGGKTWTVQLTGKVPGLETDLVISTNFAAYPFSATSVGRGCHKMVTMVHAKRVAQRRAVPPSYNAAAVNSNYTIKTTKGKQPAWMPLRAFDMKDQNIWVEFPGAPGDIGAPAVIAKTGFPVVPRIDGNFYQVDTTASSVELRLGKTVVLVEKGK